MKVFGAFIMIVVLGFAGLITTIILTLEKGSDFYPFFVPIVTIGLIIMAILATYGQLEKKSVRNSSIGFVVLCMLALVGYEGYQYYLKSLEVVSNQDVDLSVYQPYIENSKSVTLKEKSTYKINKNLPKLDGATALYPVYAAFVQAVYPKKDYPLEDSEVVSSQTIYAFDRLVNGEADCVFMAHPSEEQMAFAKQQGVELTLTPIGREAFVFFVHKDNPVEELTIEEIQGIYSGKITNWKQVGGEDEEIRAFQRPEGSGSQSALIKLMGDVQLMDPPSKDIVSGMGGIIKETSNYQNRKNAIGYSFRHFSQEMVQNGKIKNIAIEGILPTKENIQNESYPIVASFYAITANSENPNVEDFIEWILSDQGQEIIDQTGYVPLK